MTKTYEYRVCQVQMSKVTFVNGQWQGSISLEEVKHGGTSMDHALASCPLEWDYLQKAGAHGWHLAGAVLAGEVRIFYLQKENA